MKPKNTHVLHFVRYFNQATMYQKSKWYFFDQGSIDAWEKWSQSGKMPSQSGKMPPGDKAEIENAKYAKSDIFNFNSTPRCRFWTFTPLFKYLWKITQNVSFRFLIRWVLTNFTEILLHVYQVSWKWYMKITWDFICFNYWQHIIGM